MRSVPEQRERWLVVDLNLLVLDVYIWWRSVGGGWGCDVNVVFVCEMIKGMFYVIVETFCCFCVSSGCWSEIATYRLAVVSLCLIDWWRRDTENKTCFCFVSGCFVGLILLASGRFVF